MTKIFYPFDHAKRASFARIPSYRQAFSGKLKLLVLLLACSVLKANAQYCDPTISGCDESIASFQIGAFSHTSSGCGDTHSGYSNYTSAGSISLTPGTTYTVTVACSPVYSGDIVDVWIDYNQNGTFDGNELATSITGYSNTNPLSATFTVPATASGGATRLRTRVRYSSVNGSSPCANYSYGEAEDYTVNICAPTITTQPIAKDSVCAGGNTSFSVAATNAISYQWQVSTNGTTYSNITDNSVYNGSATNTLNIANTPASLNGYSYICLLGGACGTSTPSSVGLLTVNGLPTVTTQPIGTAVCLGGNATFTAAATGAAVSYQWQVNTGSGTFANVSGSAYTGGTTNTLHVISPTVAMNNYQYQLVVSGTCTPPATSAIALLQVNTPPAVTTQPVNKIICLGGTGSFSVVSSGGGLTYQWQENTGNGTFSNITDGGVYEGSTTATFSLVNPPLYMNGYSYQVVVSGACSPSTTSAAATATVSYVPGPSITALGTTTFCPGSSVIITATPNASLTYQWSLDNNTINTNGTDPSYTASDAGAYTLTVTDVNGCSGTSSPVTVSYLSAPPAAITAAGPTSFCQGNDVTLNANSGSGYTYYWKLNGNYISNTTGISYQATTPGSYTVDESNGICDIVSSPIVVTVNPLPTVSIISDNATFCPGGSATITASSVAGASFQWQQNGANINATGSSYTASTAGTYSVSVIDMNGCTASSSSVSLALNPVPAATVELSGGHPTICYNSSLALQANTGSGLSYQWFYNNHPLSNATDPVYAATESGTYSVNIMNAFGCTASSAAVSLSTDVALNPALSINGTNFCTGPFASYKWYYNNQVINGATAACYTATQNGSYAVEVFDATGCSKMSDTYSLTNVGVNNVIPAEAVSIYPNPATSVLHIDAPVVVNVSIISLDGRVVLQQNHAKDINISSLAAGIYMAGIYSADNTLIKMEKVVVNK